MAKPGRNDPCPCASGKEYKKCCLTKNEAAEREQFAETQAACAERASAHRASLREIRAAIAANLAGTEDVADELTTASNAAVELVHAGKLEQAARDLLVRFPDVHDGWDRLGMVHEARGENKQAADCYRKAVDIIRQHPDDYDPEFEIVFARLIAKLDPPPAT